MNTNKFDQLKREPQEKSEKHKFQEDFCQTMKQHSNGGLVTISNLASVRLKHDDLGSHRGVWQCL